MRFLPALVLAMGLVPCIAIAAPQQGSSSARAQMMANRVAKKFAQADANHDGKLTLDEAKAGMPRVAQHFDDIDIQHQGYVTLEQIQTYIRSRTSG